jgi:hypothetical protein
MLLCQLGLSGARRVDAYRLVPPCCASFVAHTGRPQLFRLEVRRPCRDLAVVHLKHMVWPRPQVPDVSGMMQTSDYPCMRKSKAVPDMHFRNFDIPVSATCISATI